MWSGPRNVSTAVMYAFAQRPDTQVVDEPFYAHYLLQSGADHPGRAEVLESQPRDPAIVMRKLLSQAPKHDVLFLKNMAHHMVEMDEELDTLVNEFVHVFLIRDPAEMLLSLDKTLTNPSMRDTAYRRQLQLFEKVQSSDRPFGVIDSRELLQDPKHILSALCGKLNIPFTEEMLSWDAGPIPEDGIWAKHWYDNVHQSTGFEPYIPKKESIPDRLKPLYDECRPIYNKMFAHAIKFNK